LKKFILLNDFVCNGYGLLSNIKEGEDYVRLNNNSPIPNTPLAMIGAGTGLGHGFMVKSQHSNYYEVYPSEGGHQDLAPSNNIQKEYHVYLQKFYNINHVSVERAICGEGIQTMFKFFYEKEKLESPLLKTKGINDIEVREILEYGMENKCPICVKTLETFIEIYGAAAGNFSLLIIPTGGLYLLGGITVKLIDYILKSNKFWDSFIDKGRLKPLMSTFPIFLVKNSDKVGVIGSREYARRLLEEI